MISLSIVLSDFSDKTLWGFGAVNVEQAPPISQGAGSFICTPQFPFGEGGGRMWISLYAGYNKTFPPLAGYLVLDVVESSPKQWYLYLKDSTDTIYEQRTYIENGHLLVNLAIASATVDINNLKEVNFGAEGTIGNPVPLDYVAVIGYLRSEPEIPPPLGVTGLKVILTPKGKDLGLGENLTLMATALGGNPPYNYIFTENNVVVQATNQNTLLFVPSSLGVYNFSVQVVDFLGSFADSNSVQVNVVAGLPPLPPVEPLPANTSLISVVDNQLLPQQKACWAFSFIDTATGWSVGEGEQWAWGSGAGFWSFNADFFRQNLKDIRDVFGCNTVRVFFWMDWVLNNSPFALQNNVVTMGCRDALHEFLDIAASENMLVELRMYDWTDSVHDPTGIGHHHSPLDYHTKSQFIEAWRLLALEFSKHPNVMFNLYDEPADLDIATWLDLSTRTIIRIREFGVGHVIATMFGYSGAAGWSSPADTYDPTFLNSWGKTGYAHYQTCICGHEYAYHGTTEGIHKGNIEEFKAGFPIYIGAMGVNQPVNSAELETHRRWLQENIAENMSVTIFHWGRPNTEFNIQQVQPFPALPNATGNMWIETVKGLEPPFPFMATVIVYNLDGTPASGAAVNVYGLNDPNYVSPILTGNADGSGVFTFQVSAMVVVIANDGVYKSYPTNINNAGTLNLILSELISPPPTCPAGQHWDYTLNKCVDDYTPPEPPKPSIAARVPMFGNSALVQVYFRRLRDRVFSKKTHKRLHPLI